MKTEKRERPKNQSIDPAYGLMLIDQEVAERLGWQKTTLQCRRSAGQPVPTYVKFSKRRCLTPASEVTKFIKQHLVVANQT